MTLQKWLRRGHDGIVGYQIGQSICPRCGSGTEVRTARELFDMMNGAREQAFQRLGQAGQPGSGPWQGQQAGTLPPGDPYRLKLLFGATLHGIAAFVTSRGIPPGQADTLITHAIALFS